MVYLPTFTIEIHHSWIHSLGIIHIHPGLGKIQVIHLTIWPENNWTRSILCFQGAWSRSLEAYQRQNIGRLHGVQRGQFQEVGCFSTRYTHPMVETILVVFSFFFFGDEENYTQLYYGFMGIIRKTIPWPPSLHFMTSWPCHPNDNDVFWSSQLCYFVSKCTVGKPGWTSPASSTPIDT